MRLGHRDAQGSLIANIQRRLGIGADGYFGAHTQRAVKLFQAVHTPRGLRTPPGSGLPVTGVVDDVTLEALRASLKRSRPWLKPPEIARAIGAPQPAVARQWPKIDRVMRLQKMTSVGARIAVAATVVTEVGTAFRPINEYGGRAYFTQMYEGRSDLGNVRRGDGARFHGRGYIQLTGRANYRTYGRRLGLPLQRRPTLALRAGVAARVLTDYFQQRKIAANARRGQWRQTRVKVNGGYNGWSTYRAAVSALLRASMR